MINTKEAYVKTDINGKYTISKISSDSAHYAFIELIYPHYGFINDIFEVSIIFFEKGSVKYLEQYIIALEPLGDILYKNTKKFRKIFEEKTLTPNLFTQPHNRRALLNKYPEITEMCYNLFIEECNTNFLGATAKKYIKDSIIYSLQTKAMPFFSYEISDFQNIIDNLLLKNDVIIDLSQEEDVFLFGEKLLKDNGLK